jgi:hypothetical protein
MYFIQLGICKRMVKEVDSYEKEVIVNEGRIQKMNDDGKDPYGEGSQYICYHLSSYSTILMHCMPPLYTTIFSIILHPLHSLIFHSPFSSLHSPPQTSGSRRRFCRRAT